MKILPVYGVAVAPRFKSRTEQQIKNALDAYAKEFSLTLGA